MANYANLISAIQTVITENGNNEITGPLLQQTLVSIINAFGSGYQFIGIATPETTPGTPDQKVFYIGASGTYPNFGPAVIPDGNLAVFYYDSSWHYGMVAFPLGDGSVTELKLATALINKLFSTGYKFAGIATPSTTPGTPNQNVFYIGGPGTYQNFGETHVVNEGLLGFFKYNNSWTFETVQVGKNYDDEINQLNIDVNGGESIITRESVELNATLKTDGTIHVQTGNNYVNKYSISDPTRNYFASGRVGSNSEFCLACYYDQNDTFLGYQRAGDGTATNIVDLRLVIPAGTKYIKIQGNSGQQNAVLKELVVGGLEQRVEHLEEYVEDLQEQIDGGEPVVATPVNTESNATLKTDGTIHVQTGNNYVNKYSISDPTRNYFASGRVGSNSEFCLACYYDQNDTFLGYQRAGDGTATNIVDLLLTIPTGTKYIKIQGNSGQQGAVLKSTGNGIKQGLEKLQLETNDLEQEVLELQKSVLAGKKVAIIGDSISTIYNGDSPYIEILPVDVGNTIQSYITPVDVSNGTKIGGVTVTNAMVDGELHAFTPALADVGKKLGVPAHYSGNTASVKVWSQRLCERCGATLLANASYSGSGITSMVNLHTGGYTQAWHPYTVNRCRARGNDGNYINPDVIIVYRGTNDFSYGNNGAYPTLQISDVDLLDGFNATTDKVADNIYNFLIGYYLTIKALKTAYPNATIVCCTLNVFKRVTYDVWPTRNNAFTLPELNKVIRDIANTTGCGLIEFDKDGVTFENCYPTYISDNADHPTHPNDNGHRVMAERALADLNYVLNPTA